MSRSSLASKLKEWRQTATAAAANETDLPFAKEMQAELAAAADEAEELSNRGSALKGQLQQNTLDLSNVASRANDLNARLRGGVRLAYGTRGMKLVDFGLKPRRKKPTGETSEVKKAKQKPTEEGYKPAQAVPPATDSTK
jgi:hypothetical protein